MKKSIIKKILILPLAALLFMACEHELDNYEQPETVLVGNVIDAETGKNVQSRIEGKTPNRSVNLRVRMLEVDERFENPDPVDVFVSQDGTYQTTRLFPAQYRIFAFNGPFVPVDTVLVDTSVDNGLVNVHAIPYYRISIDSVNNRKIYYTVTKSDVAPRDPRDIALMYNIDDVVDVNSSAGFRNILETRGITRQRVNGNILGVQQEFEFRHQYKVLNDDPDSTAITVPRVGEEIYVRVGVQGGGNRWNYSELVKLDITE